MHPKRDIPSWNGGGNPKSLFRTCSRWLRSRQLPLRLSDVDVTAIPIGIGIHETDAIFTSTVHPPLAKAGAKASTIDFASDALPSDAKYIIPLGGFCRSRALRLPSCSGEKWRGLGPYWLMLWLRFPLTGPVLILPWLLGALTSPCPVWVIIDAGITSCVSGIDKPSDSGFKDELAVAIGVMSESRPVKKANHPKASIKRQPDMMRVPEAHFGIRTVVS